MVLISPLMHAMSPFLSFPCPYLEQGFYPSNASRNIPTSTSVHTTTPKLDVPSFKGTLGTPGLSHKFQKLLRELNPRDCFPRADESSNIDEVVFCRKCADAERYIGLEVADEERGDDRGEWCS